MGTHYGPRRPQQAAGFTLVELMVVVSIIAILATTVGFYVMTVVDKADQTKVQHEIRTLMGALEMYRLDFKQYPESLEGLVNNAKRVRYLDQGKIPLDSWRKPYVYSVQSSREYTLVSYGADGKPGGEGYDADISSINLKGDEKQGAPGAPNQGNEHARTT